MWSGDVAASGEAHPLCHAADHWRIRNGAAQRIQDKVAAWVKEGRWAELRAEKREVLLHMQDVLRSCHTLLQTTQIPMNGVVNLLQHILK